MTFGERLNHTRKARGRTAQSMADMLCIAIRSYRAYESNTREPDFATLVKIADALGVTTDYLLGRSCGASFPARLNAVRKSRHLTALAMADYLGVTIRTYRNYESGVSQPSLETLVRIANKLNVSVDYLLGRDDFLAERAGEPGTGLPACPTSHSVQP